MKRPSGGINSVYNMFQHTSKLITFVPYGDSYSTQILRIACCDFLNYGQDGEQQYKFLGTNT